MKMSVETSDLFLGAILLASGGRLDGLSVRSRNGRSRREVRFVIGGQGLDRIVAEYRNREVTVNAIQLKQELGHLKDLMFEELRRDGGE